MQMRSSRGPGVAGIAEQFTALDVGAGLHLDAVQVAVNGRKTVVVHQLDHVAQPAVVVLGGPFHHPVGGRVDGRAALCAQIDTAVHGGAAVDGVVAHAVGAGHPA